jgi:RHS repeat-associated protein
LITRPGYVYIYLSNENETAVEVYFDDFKVEQIKSPVVQVDDYYPFGLTFNSYQRENSVSNDGLFHGKELQTELYLASYDFGRRFYSPDLGRWWQVDPLAPSPKNISTSPYVFVRNNPITLIDPDGRDWFYYQAKGEEKKTWHYQEGNKATYTNAKGKERTSRNGFDHLVVYNRNSSNLMGAKSGTITVYNQNKAVAEISGVFAGSSKWFTGQDPRKGGFEPAADGNYMFNLSDRGTMTNRQKVGAGVTNPAANYGIQSIPDGTVVVQPDGTEHSVNDDYGNGRIRMNPVDDDLNPGGRDRGYYLHGKHAWWNYRTHGCVCDKSETIFNYFWSGDGKGVTGKVPFAINVPYELGGEK